MMRVWALVPQKDLAAAKMRLATVLGRDLRRELVLAMARDVLSAVRRAGPVERVLLVSNDSDARRLLGVAGVDGFGTSGVGLNEDLASAAQYAADGGATDVLIAHADVPLLTPWGVEQFIGLSSGNGQPACVRVAPCKHGSGTNLLFAPLPLPIPLVFGQNSLARFRHVARTRKAMLDEVCDACLSIDIDDPEDLRYLECLYERGMLPGGTTSEFLAKRLVSKELAAAPPMLA